MKHAALLEGQDGPTLYWVAPMYALFDAMCIIGTLGLGVCYVWARALGHVQKFCDISDLVVHLPERILFRLNFSLVGGLLAATAVPIHAVVKARLASSQSTCLPKTAAFFQVVAGIGVVLVGACGPEEIIAMHILAAAMGFGGAGVSQILYNSILYKEESASQSAKKLHRVRCFISFLFLSSAVLLGLGEANILPEPCEHIFEWSMWFTLLAWYFTFRWDLADFSLAGISQSASVNRAPGCGSSRPRQPRQIRA